MRIKIEVCRSRKAVKQKYWARIRAANGQITFQTEMMRARQSALKTAKTMARYVNNPRYRAEIFDLARVHGRKKTG